MAEQTLDQLSSWASHTQHNVRRTISNLTLHDYIRLIIILGGYCLLRPYLLQLSAKFQAKDHERELDPDEMSSMAAVSSPNSLRSQVTVPEDSDDDDDDDDDDNDGDAGDGRGGGGARSIVRTGADWGRTARRKQRRMIRQILEADERLKAAEAEADESDKDIEEFLVN
ncbi:MAG: hypothetical protein M1837_001343 [Sclerophora amabilis]|nr:MAG: hypothetical protein M1837_001343 [Sclerophora amabilis]